MLFFEIEENSPTLLLLQLGRSRISMIRAIEVIVDAFREIRPDLSSRDYDIKSAVRNLVK